MIFLGTGYAQDCIPVDSSLWIKSYKILAVIVNKLSAEI